MTHLGRSLLRGLLIAGVLVVAAPGQSGEIRIKGNNRDEKLAPRPSAKAPKSAGVSVLRAEFGESSRETAPLKATEPGLAETEGILVYATEYFTKGEERVFKGSLPAGTRPSEIRYGTGEPRSEIRYGSGEPRSEIRYGTGEQRSEIRYGTGERRSEISYGVSDGARNNLRYGGTAQR
jgi:hypothetical protein